MIAFRLRFDALRRTYGRVRRRLRVARGLVNVAALLAIDAVLRLMGKGLLDWGWSAALIPFVFVLPWRPLLPRRAHGRVAARDAAALDHHFHLSELFTTAVEVDRRGQRTTVESQLLADAAQAAQRLDHPKRLTGNALRVEAQAVLGCLLLTAGLHLLGLTLPLAMPERMPDLIGLGTGTDRGGEAADEGDGGLVAGSAGAGSAAGLAAALGDHGAGREIAQALAQGRPGDAAAAARRLADQAGRMSESGRRDLAAAMQTAAATLPPEQANLRRALLEAAAAMQESGAERETRLGALASLLAILADARGAATVMPRAPSRPVLLGQGSSAAVGEGGGGGTDGSGVTGPAARDADPLVTALRPATGSGPLLLPEATVLPLADRVDWSEREWLIQAFTGLDEAPR